MGRRDAGPPVLLFGHALRATAGRHPRRRHPRMLLRRRQHRPPSLATHSAIPPSNQNEPRFHSPLSADWMEMNRTRFNQIIESNEPFK